MKRIFKTGSTFKVPMRLIDLNTKDGIQITSAMSLTAKVADSNRNLITNLTVTAYPDQVLAKGWCATDLPSNASTDNWPLGDAILEVVLSLNGQVLKSADYDFKIEKGL